MTVRAAALVAMDVHRAQTDLAGKPYIDHVMRVAETVAVYGDEAMMVALLHDVIEDGAVTIGYLYQKFPAAVVKAVDALTHRRHESYTTYIERVGKVELARLVKIADLQDNLRDDRKLPLSQANVERGHKYVKALEYLQRLEEGAKDA